MLSLSLIDTDLYTCLSDGEIQVWCLLPNAITSPTLKTFSSFKRWSGSFACSAVWRAHDGIVLSSIIVPSRRPITSSLKSLDSESHKPQWDLITGASDNHIKVTTMPFIRPGSTHIVSLMDVAMGRRASPKPHIRPSAAATEGCC